MSRVLWKSHKRSRERPKYFNRSVKLSWQ